MTMSFVAVPAMLLAGWIEITTAAVPAEESVIEEVVVTALRRDLTLSQVPDAVTVFDQAEIEAAGIQRLNDVARLTPNLRFSDDQEVGVGTVTIRGVTQNRGIGETPVAFIVDGVAVNTSLITTQDFFDLAQIEVLRGPQGALHGRNAVAGAINITTRRPTEAFEAYTTMRAADGDDYTLEGAVSGAILDDRFRVRVSGYAQERNGQLYNATIDELVDYKSSVGLRARALYDPTDRLSIDLRYQHSDQEGGSGYFMPGSADTEENRLPGDPFPFPLNNTTYTIQSNLLGVSDVVFDEYTIKVDTKLGAVDLTSITSYNDLESNNDQDLDQTAQEFLNIIVNDDSSQFTQELRLASAGGRRFDWVTGVYYSDQERDRSLATLLNVAGFANGGDWSTPSAFFVPQPPAVLNETYETRAVYGQLDVDLAERWGLSLAGRYDRVTRNNDSSNPASNGSATFSESQPKVQLSFAASDDLNLFGTISRGFRPGGFNTLAAAPEVQFEARFDAETLTNYELGARYRDPAGRWSLNAALFHIDYEDQQFFLFDPFGSQALINADESRIDGGELEVSWELTDRFTLHGAYGFTDSEIEAIGQEPGLTVPAGDVIGNEVPNAPVYSLNLVADYTRPIGNLEWNTRVEFERRGRTWFTIDGAHSQDPYNLVNLRLGLAGDNWQLAGFVDNVFDEDWIEFYFSRRFIGLRTDIAWPSPDRLAGLELTWRF
ncbi:MAG: TonB-dependent receptor [Xanthomonadales bacterium]|nr:TonB-dependent receptor [Xanthomonadales bacterium]